MQDAVRPAMPSSCAPLTFLSTGTTSSSSNGSSASGTPTLEAKATIPSLDGVGLLRTRPPPSRHLLPPAAVPLPCTPVAREQAGEPPLVTAQGRLSQTSWCRIYNPSCARCQHTLKASRRSGISTSPRCVFVGRHSVCPLRGRGRARWWLLADVTWHHTVARHRDPRPGPTRGFRSRRQG